MPIDDCAGSFAELAATILPAHMALMRRAMTGARPMSGFCTPGVGHKTILSSLGRSADFSGCYVLLHEGRPLYVGISRGVIGRLRQHCNGTTHFDASLAYRMANKKTPHGTTSKAGMQDATFRAAFKAEQAFLRTCTVAFIEIPNPLELYLFEAYCSMELDTCEWNTFRTH